MKQTITLIFIIICFSIKAQTIPFTQIQKATGTGSTVVTGTNGALTYTPINSLPYVSSTTSLTINGVTKTFTNTNLTYTVGDLLSTNSYSDPAWLTYLGWPKIINTPTTIAGYGITDAVPYLGATNNLNLGTNNFSNTASVNTYSVYLKPNGAQSPFIELQTAAGIGFPAISSTYGVQLFSGTQGAFSWYSKNPGGYFYNRIITSGNTTNRLYTLPDNTGTVALTSDLAGYTPTVSGGYEPKLNGTGFVKSTGTVTTYDNSTYLTSANTSTLYLPINNPTYTGSLTTGAPTYTDINIWSFLQGSNNNYYQAIWQNTNNGNQASTKLVISNDLGTKTSYYGNFGMNSSTFTGTPIFNKPNMVYLTGTTGDLAVGTTSTSSFYVGTNNATRFKIDSLGAARLYSTTSTPTINGSFWYDGGIGSKNGFNFFSNDVGNASNTFNFGNGTNNLSLYQDHGVNNWLYVGLGKNIVLSVDNGNTQGYQIDNGGHSWTILTQTVGSETPYRFSTANSTNQTASTEQNAFSFAPTSIQLATGNLAIHRAFRLGQQTLKFVAASTNTDAANMYIEGPVIAGTNASIINTSGLLIGGLTGTNSVGAGSTNGYGLSVYAPTGATNNYAARFLQGNVGIGTSAPAFSLDVAGTGRFTGNLTSTGITNTGGITTSTTFSAGGASTTNGITNTGVITSTSLTIGSSAQTNSLVNLRLVKNTATVEIGEYSSGRPAIWFNQPTASATNWILGTDATQQNMFFNAATGGQAAITVAGAIMASFAATTNYILKPTRIGSVTAPSATLDVTGTMNVSSSTTLTGVSNAYAGKSANYTLTATDYLIEATANTFTLTLPASASNTGRMYIIKNTGAGSVTIQGNGAELIDGTNTKILSTQYSGVALMCTGTKFLIIASF